MHFPAISKVSCLVVLTQMIALCWPAATQAAEFGNGRIVQNSKGEQVIKVRCLLREHGFVPVQEKDPRFYDHHLVDTVRDYQRSVGLPEPGNIGLATLASLKKNRKAWQRCTQNEQLPDPVTGFSGIVQAPLTRPSSRIGKNVAPLLTGMAECRSIVPQTAAEVNADFNRVLKLQVLMDRHHFSSGELDGVCGSNTRKALFDWQTHGPGAGLDPLDEQAVDEELRKHGGPALREHVLSADDVAGPFLDNIPVDPEEKAALLYLGYTSRMEKLGEVFQTSIRALVRLNPGSTFSEGEKINVPRLGEPLRIGTTDYWLELQAGREVLFLRTEETVIARWPVTINPQNTPTARMEIGSRAPNPNYTDRRQIDGRQRNFIYQRGPNNPVGSDWLSLVGIHPSNRGIKGFGLHGSPDPSGISKQISAGCIRMTNWDIEELAGQLNKRTALIPVS